MRPYLSTRPAQIKAHTPDATCKPFSNKKIKSFCGRWEAWMPYCIIPPAIHTATQKTVILKEKALYADLTVTMMIDLHHMSLDLIELFCLDNRVCFGNCILSLFSVVEWAVMLVRVAMYSTEKVSTPTIISGQAYTFLAGCAPLRTLLDFCFSNFTWS